MPAYEVQGPFGLQFNLQTHIPGTLSVVYDTGEHNMLVPVRTRSQPIGESSQGPSFGRRRQSELSIDIPLPVYRPPLAVDNAPQEQSTSSPSPAPTEIIPTDLTQEEIVEDIQRSGIKVRDFAYENTVPVEQRAPELFDPVLAWNLYEVALENPDPRRSPVIGRHLRRLLGIGWVSEETEGERWLQKDREALEKFDSRPHYPWKVLKLTKPQKEDLRDVATARFQWVNADQLLPQFVNRGMSRLAAAFRRPRSHQPKRPTDDSTAPEQDSGLSPRTKKRRLSNSVTPSDETQPTSSQHTPLPLVSGKPPQQFPAGQPSDSFPSSLHPPTLPQPVPSHSLPRQLSMATVPSSRPSDHPRSDSPIALAQSASRD
ncbi:hypothetical protein BU15DRAFT_77245 [Melanogaster broomeanus]|nr:hypothetical protein BU15DRAFT_77245 [Melanogaster broomeanus]